MKYLLLLTLLSLLLCQGLDAKKIKEKPKREVKPEEPANQESLNHHSPPHQEFIHEPSNNNEDPNQERKLVRPKSLKVLSTYEQCKMDCKRQRDQESAHEYVERLREELKTAEEQLAHRDDRIIEL